MNENILEVLDKVDHILDQVIIGETRVSKNISLVSRILVAAREEDLGPDTNAVLDKLIVIAGKATQIVGEREAAN